MMGDWREIDTSTADGRRQLDRVVAERLGWRPNGEGWEYDHPSGIVAIVMEVPYYTKDIHAALGLVTNDADIFILEYWPLTRIWEAAFNPTTSAQADTPALAVIKAWLTWKDASA